ncbi:hypothetical protein EYF80_001125 [Liparis tanakae]|uniref:Uncharacterized protein n=1 Tax=Liparis tanakae TaxID=230148 RepID=A0A4Z2JG26_9TELE|nr:hypothetical protein EYF80_001125 [Liparis tanakae]
MNLHDHTPAPLSMLIRVHTIIDDSEPSITEGVVGVQNPPVAVFNVSRNEEQEEEEVEEQEEEMEEEEVEEPVK